MEFLKDALDEQIYTQVVKKLSGNAKVKLANLADGQYVAKYKFDKLERKFKEITEELNDHKKVDIAAIMAENDDLKHQIAAIGKGVPVAIAKKCIRFAETYMTDKVDFSEALDLMLKDFPLSVGSEMPGLGKNSPTHKMDTQQTHGLTLEKAAGICLTAEMIKADSEPGFEMRIVIE